MNDFLVQLKAILDTSNVEVDYNKLEKKLEKKGIKLNAVLDAAKSEQELKNLVNRLQDILKSADINIGTSTLIKSISQVAKETSKIFNTAELDKQGQIYIRKVNNTVEATKSILTSKLKSAGYSDIKITGVEKANGQIKSLTASVTDAEGAMKRLTFTKERIQASNGKTPFGFVQTDTVKVLDNVSNLVTSTSAKLETMKQKWSDQGILVGEFKNKVNQLENALKNVSSKGELNQLKTDLQNLNTESSKLVQIGNIQSLIDTGAYDSKVTDLIGKTRQWTTENGNAVISTTNLSNALTSLNNAQSNLQTSNTVQNQQALISAEKELEKQIQSVTNSVRSMNAEFAKDSSIASFHNIIGDFMSKNGATMKVRAFGTELTNMYKQTAQGAQISRQDLMSLVQNFNRTVIAARNAGKLGKTFFQTIKEGAKSFSYWTSSTFLVMKSVQKIKEAFNELKDINTTITEISKTNETLTKQQLGDLASSSFNKASKYGREASNYLSGIQEASRAGYSNAEDIAELSVLAQSAGDMTDELANKYIIATDAAYKLQGKTEKLNAVLDGQNYITNHNAVSMSNLAEATKVTASQAASSNVAIEEMTAAVSTMIATTQEGGDVAGRAFKAILMNVQQVKGELDDGEIIDEEQLSKYEKAADDLGVKLKEVKNGYLALRDPMQVLKELSASYTSLEKDDARRANLISAIGGKYRGNQLNALLENWDEYEKMLSEYSKGTGSAMEEAMKSANNWEGSLNKVANTWTKTVNNLINSDDMIHITENFNEVLKVVDKLTESFGLLGTIGLGAGLFASFKNVGIFRTINDDIIGATKSIGLFGLSFNELKSKLSDIRTNGSINTLFNTSNIDKNAIDEYNRAIKESLQNCDSFADRQVIMTNAMSRTNRETANLISYTNGATVSEHAFAAAQQASTIAAKAKSLALKAASIAATMFVFTLAIKGIQALTTRIKNINNVNEKLEKRISSLKDKYSDYSSQLNDINSKLEENKKRIQEILALNTPTYVDEKELSKLREENSLLERNAELTQKAKDATAQKAIDALEKQFDREFVTNDAKHEDATKLESIEDYAKNIFTFGMYNAFQSAKISDEDSELEKLKAHINELEGLIELRDKILSQDSDFSAYEHLSDVNNKIDEYEKASKLGRLDHKDAKLLQELKEEKENMLSEGIVDLSDFGDFTNIEEINTRIASLTDNLSSYNSELMTTLNEVSEYDPNYESSFAQHKLIRYIDEIYKYTNPDEWIQSTVDKIYNTERFSDITKAINEKLSNGEEIKYEDLLSDDSYKNLVKAISLSLYNSADDDSIAKAASYVAQKIASLITNNEVVVPISLDEAIGKLAKDDKEKLLQLATAGELSADTLSSTDKYKKLLLETGLSAEELLDAIQKLNVATKTKDVDDLSTVLTKVQNGASFSATEIADLVSKNEDLSKAVKITADGYSLEEDAVLSLLNSNISLYNTSVANEINRTQTQIEATKTRIKALKEEMVVSDKVASATIKASTSPILAQNGFFGSVFGGVANDMGNALNDSAQKQIDESEKELNSLYTHLDQLFKDPFKQEKESSSKSEKDSSSVFDWIETRISRIQRSFEKMVDSVTKYVSTHFKLDTIDKEMSKIDEQISTYQQAVQRYKQEADDVSLSSDLKNKVISGEIDITTISDEKTSKAVNDFKTWYEKYLESIDKVVSLQNDKRDKLREKIDARLFGIQTGRERLSIKSDKWQDKVDYKESLGKSVYSSDYRWMINNATQQYSNIESENTILNDYLSTLNKTSEEWADIQSKIESNESSMRDLIASQVEWSNKIAQMPIDKAEKTIDKLATKREYINAKYDNSTSSFNQREMNQNLAKNLKNELSAYRESYNTTGKNLSTAKYNINQLQANSSIISKVQRYTKSGKDIPADVLSSVYSSGNVRLINRVNQYIATLTAKQTAYDTYKLNKELTKSELSEIGQKNLETISNAYANKYTTIDNKKSYLNAQKENTEASGKYITSTYYKQMIAQTAKELNAKMEEQKKLQSIIDKNVKDGLWTKSSQAYKDSISEVTKLKTEIVELATEQKNYNKELNQLPIDKIQTALDILDKLYNRDSSANNLKKAQGKDLSVSDYQKELNNYQKQINETEKLRKKYWGIYWDAKEKGRTAKADEYLQKYYEQGTAINNLKTSYEELKDTMRDDVYWRSLERMHTEAENIKNILSSLCDLFNDDMLFDDNGNFTDIGIAKVGTLVKSYETAQKEIQNYTNDIKNLNKLYSQGLYTEDEYKDKLAELQEGLMSATNDVKSFTDSIVEMYVSQKDAELDALNKLIDKRKEALNAKKAYYDYDRTIKSKTKDIKALQAQIAALEGVNTAESKAQLARAKSELQQAQEELEDTKFEHKIELIVNGFDSLQTELQENHDDYIKSLKSSFDKQIEIVESANSVYAESYKQIISSMTKMLEYYGVDTSAIKVNELAGFAEGGVIRKKVHQNGDSALVSVNPEETILTSDFTKILPQAVSAMENFIKPQIPNYDKVLSSVSVRETPNVTFKYDNLINIDPGANILNLEKATMDILSNNTKTIAKYVSKDFKDQIGKITKQRWR